MSKVYGKDSTPNNTPNRNTVDMSFDNHLTMKQGVLYPCLCKAVLPGDSVELDTAFGFRFMPMNFPVQNKMRAYVHYFYVRERNLWSDWKDFISNTKDGLVRPFLSGTSEQYLTTLGTGLLGDYLNVPTTLLGPVGSNKTASHVTRTCSISSGGSGLGRANVKIGTTVYTPDKLDDLFSYATNNELNKPIITLSTDCVIATSQTSPFIGYLLINLTSESNSFDPLNDFFIDIVVPNARRDMLYLDLLWNAHAGSGANPLFYSKNKVSCPLISYPVDSTKAVYRLTIPQSEFHDIAIAWNGISGGASAYLSIAYDQHVLANYSVPANNSAGFAFGSFYSYPQDINKSGYKPYGSGSGKKTIIASPFRAYEQIYNAFYRDERNNPYYLNGKAEYQKFIPNDSGGADSYPYRLRYRNWEQDQFTTAVPSPQQGNAPLVGITSTGVATFVDDANGKEYSVRLTATDGDHVDGVEYLENVPNSVARSLVNVVTSGISINDFRNVNSFQRWLETNMRKGYKYKDQILGHYGVDTSYAELDMPEFLGGVTQDIDVFEVTQNSSSVDGSPLGSFAGRASVMGKAKHKISKYFDEHGWLIGIICIAPSPVYTSCLPKEFMKTELLDIYFPEFGKIGYQPIRESELHIQGSNSETFGYQRPWYEYLSSLDEAHGEFRTNLRDFLVQRSFYTPPKLGPDFTVMNDSHLNDIFSVSLPTDKILGQISFRMTFKRPIPLIGVPSLE